MPNERLRAALLENGLTPAGLAEHIGVDHKTVERWIGGRLPYRRHRYSIATRLKVEEKYLWPDALSQDQVAAASEGEVVAIYPHRSDVRHETWMRLFDAATSEIGILVYAGMFLAEDASLQRLLVAKAKTGVRVRVLIGDPDSPEVAERGHDEEIGEAMAAKVRNVRVLYKPLRAAANAEVRLHRTVLYNSIYRADNQILVNMHVYGVPAYNAPVLHLRKIAGGEIAATYLDSFEHVWNTSIPAPED